MDMRPSRLSYRRCFFFSRLRRVLLALPKPQPSCLETPRWMDAGERCSVYQDGCITSVDVFMQLSECCRAHQYWLWNTTLSVGTCFPSSFRFH